MSKIDDFLNIRWSEEDGCFVGSCPALFYGGCHGDNQDEVRRELLKIVEDVIEEQVRRGEVLPAWARERVVA